MKLRLCLAAPLLLLVAACAGTTVDPVSGFAMGVCERSSSCTVRDTGPRHGPQHQRVVEDEMKGRQEPM